jgi:hypothetical protein
MSQQNCILTVQSSVEKRDLAVATSSCNFFMMLASSIGIAIYQALYSVFLKAQFMGLDPTVLATANQYGALQNFLYIRNMPAEIQAPVIHAYSAAIHNLFILPIGAAGLGVICTLFFKNVRYGELEATQIDDVASEDERNEKIQV